MNIFALDTNPRLAARYHCDSHTVKMLVEHAQILSTAHRVLDGVQTKVLSANGRRITQYKLSDERESVLYKCTHINHPSAVWARKSKANYQWLFECTMYLFEEYTHRYGKIHATQRLAEVLVKFPRNIADTDFEPQPLAMPEHCKIPGNVVESYRNYYRMEKTALRQVDKTRRADVVRCMKYI